MKKNLIFTRRIVYIFALEVVLFWGIWFINDYLWLNYFDNVSDVLRVVLIIGFIVIVISAITAFIYLFAPSSNHNSVGTARKFFSWIVLIIFVAVHIGMLNYSYDSGYTTGGLFSISDKQETEGSYYFYVMNSDDRYIKLDCDKSIYDELICNEEVLYTMEYRWVKYSDRGAISNIDTNEYIDNRR